ncbi:sigma-70 family RNA polymerase sigma factor [Planomonospora sp. ID82291]|nr:sigma-70 family RNA polymerase sigma factor [Planomonospora sp. ID82291]
MTRRRITPKDPVDRIAAEEGAKLLLQVLDTLSERERGVIEMRFGISSGIAMTLDEIGRVYGVTRERIRQIETKVLSKLRHPGRSRVLGVYDESGYRVGIVDVAGKRRLTGREQYLLQKRQANSISCAHCGAADFASRSDRGGRPRKYCSNKCRQAGYRERRSQANSP